MVVEDDSQTLSWDYNDGYLCVQRLASFAAYGEHLSDGRMVTQKLDFDCRVWVDLYGDPNSTLVFIGYLVRVSSGHAVAPSVNHIVEEMRLSSSSNMDGFDWNEIIYQRVRDGNNRYVTLRNTVFDLSFWDDREVELRLFEDAVNQLLFEENEKVKPEYRKPLPGKFRVLNLDELYEEISDDEDG